MDWGVSLASLSGGILTIFVFQRGLPHVAWIVGYLLLLCLLFAFLVEMRRPLEESGRKSGRFILTAANYTIQTLYHAILLFLIPAYWASTTLTSINVVFLAVLVAMAVLATFDPWYRALVHPRPGPGSPFFAVSPFAPPNLGLPLIGLPPARRQPVRHVWRHNGQVVETVGLAPVLGGRREGYRTYSRKTAFPAEASGRWSVDVVTGGGQLIGRLRFRVAVP